MKGPFIGIGGWTYEPWRGLFYPRGLPHKKELEYAASRLSAIEINATFHRKLARSSFQRWHDDTPADFVFSVKASFFCTNRKDLTTAGPSIDQFMGQGLDALGKKLGPILWQLAPTKQLNLDEMDGFLSLLPRGHLHAFEPRHVSYDDPRVIALAKKHGVALVRTDSAEYPNFDIDTSAFTYARLCRTESRRKLGYAPAALDRIADEIRAWKKPAYVFVVNGAKERAPAAAQALMEKLKS